MDNNELFSKLKGNDLDELIKISLNFEYIYRFSRNLPEHLTFGLEIEYETEVNDDNKIIKDYVEHLGKKWIYTGDDSVRSGGEVISPILHDKKEYWIDLKNICEYLKQKNVVVNGNAAGHIHIGANVIGDDYKKWIEFIKLYMYYENIICRYAYGEELTARRSLRKYAKPIAQRLYEMFYYFGKIDSLEKIIKYLPNSRYYSINFSNIQLDNISDIVDKNTIEFRCPNGTINEKIWQNNINTFAKMFLAVMNNKIDTEYIDYEVQSEETCFNKDFYYNEVYLRKALEFVDTIFDNNLDKIMFLKQYLKDLIAFMIVLMLKCR